jgi:hypothetical protein
MEHDTKTRKSAPLTCKLWRRPLPHISTSAIWVALRCRLKEKWLTFECCAYIAPSHTADKNSFAYYSARDRWPIIMV